MSFEYIPSITPVPFRELKVGDTCVFDSSVRNFDFVRWDYLKPGSRPATMQLRTAYVVTARTCALRHSKSIEICTVMPLETHNGYKRNGGYLPPANRGMEWISEHVWDEMQPTGLHVRRRGSIFEPIDTSTIPNRSDLIEKEGGRLSVVEAVHLYHDKRILGNVGVWVRLNNTSYSLLPDDSFRTAHIINVPHEQKYVV